MEGKNPFYERLKEYQGKNVVVAFKSNKQALNGKIVAVNFTTLNFIVEGTDGRDYIVRDDISYIAIDKNGGNEK